MKYYDGMGRDVTDYVTGLEKKIAELEAKTEKPAETSGKWIPLETPVDIHGSEIEPKPVRRPRKVADTE